MEGNAPGEDWGPSWKGTKEEGQAWQPSRAVAAGLPGAQVPIRLPLGPPRPSSSPGVPRTAKVWEEPGPVPGDPGVGSRESGWGWGGLTAPPRGSALGLQQLRKGLPRIRPPGDPPLGLVRPTHSLDPRNTLVSSERPPALTGRKRTQRGTADFPQSHPILPHRGVILPILGKQK